MGGDGSSPLKMRCRNSIQLDALTSFGDATPGAASLARTVASSACQRLRRSSRSVMLAPRRAWEREPAVTREVIEPGGHAATETGATIRASRIGRFTIAAAAASAMSAYHIQ